MKIYAMARYFISALVLSVVCSTLINAEGRRVRYKADEQQLLVESIHILGGFNSRVPRWSGNIRLAVVGDLSDSVEKNLDALLVKLSLYSGLEFRRIEHNLTHASLYFQAISTSPAHDLTVCSKFNSAECANLVVIVSSQAEMSKIAVKLPMRTIYRTATAGAQTLYCFFSPGVSRSFEIMQSVVFVNSNLSEEMQHTCLQEEITQSLGLFNDYSDSVFYSFNNIVSPKQLTTHDKILLSSLYDRAFSTGALAGSFVEQIVEYSVNIPRAGRLFK